MKPPLMTQLPHPGRRKLLAAAGAASLAGWARLSLAAGPAAGSARFVLVLLRGGLDGLSAVPVTGDPQFAAARGVLAQFGSAPLPLTGPYALHPRLAQMHALYQQGELAVVHAVGLPYRERSHFDAQQVLESGGSRPYQLQTGWLARALAASSRRGLALTAAVPLVLRGPAAAVDTWAPATLPEPPADLLARLQQLYAGDAALAGALQRARALREQPLPAAAAGAAPAASAAAMAAARGRTALVALARSAGEFLAAPQGPSVAVLEMGGWDTHVNQASPQGALAQQLSVLDEALAALRGALGGSGEGQPWQRTVVLVATEFGREVAINGTGGTDHGSGGACFVLGGAVQGGQVLADWPGLAPAQRHEGRDLKTTTDLRAVLKPILADHLKVPANALARSVLPDAAGVAALRGLLRG